MNRELKNDENVFDYALPFRTFFEDSIMGVFILNKNGFLYINSQFENIFGYSLDDLLQKNIGITDIIISDEQNNLVEKILAKLSGESGSEQYTIRCYKKDGTTIYVDLLIRPIQFNETTKIVGFTADVSERIRIENQLQESEQRYKSLFDHDINAIYSFDINGNVTSANKASEIITGYSHDQLLQCTYKDCVTEDELMKVCHFFNLTIIEGKTVEFETEGYHKDGHRVHVRVKYIPIYVNGEITGAYGIAQNITKQKLSEEKLMESEKRFRSLIQYSSDVIAIIDQNNTIRYISPSVEKVLGYRVQDLIGISSLDIVHPVNISEVNKSYAALLNHLEQDHSEIRLLHRDGTWRDVEVTRTNMYHESSINGVVLNIRDITEKKQAEKLIEHLAFHDDLTNLPNRRLLEHRLKNEISLAKNKNYSFGVFVVDLDHFKFINDTIGHDIGDKLLIEVANRLKSRRFHDFIARMDGNEFAIVVKNTQSLVFINHIAQQIIEVFSEPFTVDTYEFHVTASIGISVYPDGGKDFQLLLKNANSAMYRAKELGKSQYQIYGPQINVETYKSYTLQNDLRRALQDEQFELHYQPRVDINTNQIIGAEALIRWNHPNWGQVSPDEFILMAEKSGLIIEMGEWVLRTVCRQIRKWKQDGLPSIKVSVNFSALQFLQSNIVEVIEKIIKESQVDPKWLEIEVTETVFLEKEQGIRTVINELKHMGFNIALDDFGTGYSSLSYLREYKVDTLKIDKSFIGGIPGNIECNEIVSAIIQLAKKLKINIVAEGVETIPQLALLKRFGCDEVQGFLYSKPVSTEEFEKLLIIGKCTPMSSNTAFHLPIENQRKFFRIMLDTPLLADMTILKIGGKDVQVGSTEVSVEDIGPGGLRFKSTIRLPKKNDLILGFETQILGQTIRCYGRIVWSRELSSDLSQYGVEFSHDDIAQETLVRILNYFQIQLRRNPGLPLNCRFAAK